MTKSAHWCWCSCDLYAWLWTSRECSLNHAPVSVTPPPLQATQGILTPHQVDYYDWWSDQLRHLAISTSWDEWIEGLLTTMYKWRCEVWQENLSNVRIPLVCSWGTRRIHIDWHISRLYTFGIACIVFSDADQYQQWTRLRSTYTLAMCHWPRQHGLTPMVTHHLYTW